MSDATADDQEVEVESENEGDRPGSREVTPAALRGPAEGEAHSPGEGVFQAKHANVLLEAISCVPFDFSVRSTHICWMLGVT